MRNNGQTGQHGELITREYLRSLGWQLLGHNWRCRYGELDLIASDAGELVIVEVKTRRGTVVGSPLEAVTAAKAQRLRLLAQHWLIEADRSWATVRFDVVGVVLCGSRAYVDHLRAAFS